MHKQLIVIGAGGHGKVVADIAEKCGYSDILFFDDCPSAKFCGKYAVVGKASEAINCKKSDFIVAIGNADIRRRLQSELSANGLCAVSLVHPSAVVASDVQIGVGTAIMAGAVINPGAEIGEGCIVNTCASVDHDCRIGDFAHISVGARVCGTVTVGENTWIGAGTTIINNVAIASDSTIGAGAVVIGDITECGTYVGVPAKKIKD